MQYAGRGGSGCIRDLRLTCSLGFLLINSLFDQKVSCINGLWCSRHCDNAIASAGRESSLLRYLNIGTRYVLNLNKTSTSWTCSYFSHLFAHYNDNFFVRVFSVRVLTRKRFSVSVKRRRKRETEVEKNWFFVFYFASQQQQHKILFKDGRWIVFLMRGMFVEHPSFCFYNDWILRLWKMI